MRIALVGGSNGLVNGGFGQRLSNVLKADFFNYSLGDSPSLRGVDFLLREAARLNVDKILFEYLLNDLIFESANTIDPLAHFHWLEVLVTRPQIRNKLVFLNLCGANAVHRVGAKRSLIAQNYDKIARLYGIDTIDGTTLIYESMKDSGNDAVFHQYNHFTPDLVGKICDMVIADIQNNKATYSDNGFSKAHDRLSDIDLARSQLNTHKIEHFRTSVFEGDFLHLTSETPVEITPTGNFFAGFYALLFPNSGFLKIDIDGLCTIKPCGHNFNLNKPFVSLRHLSRPIAVSSARKLLLSVHAHPPSDAAHFDHTQGAVYTGYKSDNLKLGIGRLLFLDSPMHK
ncbi:MAG: hypothetical protein GXP04_05600 [Alphaproteobacteria bacterium]|nr:hypothetical protein [Alphaproteobacteria bacterium]